DVFDDNEEPTNEEQIMLNDSINTTDLLSEVKAKIYTILCYYYPNPVLHGLVSALLDPRLKSLDFVKVTNKLAAERILRNLYDYEKLLENEENLSQLDYRQTTNENEFPSCIALANESLFFNDLGNIENIEEIK
ncbi:18632_t:CDS:2, partial [Racocetra fulgida]